MHRYIYVRSAYTDCFPPAPECRHLSVLFSVVLQACRANCYKKKNKKGRTLNQVCVHSGDQCECSYEEDKDTSYNEYDIVDVSNCLDADFNVGCPGLDTFSCGGDLPMVCYSK